MSVIMIPFFIDGMDQKKMHNESIIDIIEVANVRELAFLGNEQVIIRPRGKKPFVYDRSIKSNIDFIADDHNIDILPACIVTDHAKKRALVTCGHFPVETMVVYDSVIKKTIVYPDVCGDLRKICRNSFDERKPNSILLLQKYPDPGCQGKIVSYDYINKQTHIESFLSRAIEESASRYCHHVLNASTGLRGIVTETADQFKMYTESISGNSQILQYKKEIPGRVDQNFICSSDMSFIGYYSADNACPHEESLHTEGRVCNICDACYILNLKTGQNIRCQNEVGGVLPYAMNFHPNNKAMVTLSAINQWVEYWQADTGTLLAQQKLPKNYAKKSSVDEVGTFKQSLSFSKCGIFLAVAFANTSLILKVPFEAIYSIDENKAIAILWCVKNMTPLLPKDIQGLLIDRLKL